MGKSGFSIIESGSKTLAADTDLITDFTLPDDWPDELFTFLQIQLSLSESTIISIIRDGTAYPINNNAEIIGEVYRSIPIQKGEVINIQFGTTQTLVKFKFALEE